MSLNNLPNRLPSVEKLISRVKSAERSQQKEIRISIEEARDLTEELAIMTAKMSNTIKDIHEILKEIKASSGTVEVKVDGGGFSR